MTDHVRHQLRDALVTKLTGLTTTGSRVHTARVYPAAEAALPLLMVNTVAEDSQTQTIGLNGLQQRSVSISIDGVARATTGLADALDAIAFDVETALAGEITVSNQSIPLEYRGAHIEFSGEGDEPIGRVSLQYTATLFTAANAPGSLV